MSRRKRSAEDVEEHVEQDVEQTRHLTRTARTRAATEVNKVGLRLAELPPDALDQLELPEELRDAIDLCQRMKIRGRSRQKRLICQLLRAEDHEAITQRVEALEAAMKRAKAAGA